MVPAMTPPPPKHTERGVETRKRIVDAATDLFINRGYAATPVSAIISASGVTKGGFYFHFPSKAALGAEVIASTCQYQQALALDAVDPSLSSLEMLMSLPAAVAASMQDSPPVVLLGRLTMELRDEPDAETVDPYAFWFEIVADLVRGAQADGDIDTTLDPDATAYHLVTSYIGSDYVECVRGGGDTPTVNPHLDDYLAFALRSMGVDPASVQLPQRPEPNPLKGAD